MKDRPPLSEAEVEAGLDCMDEPWPVIEMERIFVGTRGRAWSYPRWPSGIGGPKERYVPAGDRRALEAALADLPQQPLSPPMVSPTPRRSRRSRYLPTPLTRR